MANLMKRNSGFFPFLFDDFFTRDGFTFPGPDWVNKFNSPSVNVVDNDDHFLMEVAAPGMNKEDFKIEFENNTLTISGESKKEDNEESKNYSMREYRYSSFKRSFSLEEKEVDLDKVEASYTDGILSIHLPKKEILQNGSRSIEIK